MEYFFDTSHKWTIVKINSPEVFFVKGVIKHSHFILVKSFFKLNEPIGSILAVQNRDYDFLVVDVSWNRPEKCHRNVAKFQLWTRCSECGWRGEARPNGGGLDIWSMKVWMIGCRPIEMWWWQGWNVGTGTGRLGECMWGMTWNFIGCGLNMQCSGICGWTLYMGQMSDPCFCVIQMNVLKPNGYSEKCRLSIEKLISLILNLFLKKLWWLM